MFEGFVVQTVRGHTVVEDGADEILFGIGPEGGEPVAYLACCPCCGIENVAHQIGAAIARSDTHHRPGHHTHQH